MVTDMISLFKLSLVDHLKSLKVDVNLNAIKMLDHHVGDILVHCGKIICDEDLTKKLKSLVSEMKIDNVISRQNQLIIKLDRLCVFTECLKELFRSETLFPIEGTHLNEQIDLIYDASRSPSDLTDCRIDVLVQTVRNLIKSVGYEVSINQPNINGLYFTYKSNLPKNVTLSHTLVLCGSVLNACNNTKEREITTDEYKKKKKAMLHQEMQNRSKIDDDVNETLTDAIIKFEFLRVKPSSPVILNFSEEESNSTGCAVFVLYNQSRLNAIVQEFETRVQKGYYPPLPPIDQVDFSLLKEEKEWNLMFNYVVRFPLILRESVQFIREGKPSPHLLCSFLFAFTRTISSYYRNTKILLEAKPALLRSVYVRIYFVKALQRILISALALLNIRAVPAL